MQKTRHEWDATDPATRLEGLATTALAVMVNKGVQYCTQDAADVVANLLVADGFCNDRGDALQRLREGWGRWRGRRVVIPALEHPDAPDNVRVLAMVYAEIEESDHE